MLPLHHSPINRGCWLPLTLHIYFIKNFDKNQMEVPTGLEPVHNGFAIRRLTSLAKEPYLRSLVAERATNPPFTLLRTPHSSCPTGSAYLLPWSYSFSWKETILSTSTFLLLAICIDHTKLSRSCFFKSLSAKDAAPT